MDNPIQNAGAYHQTGKDQPDLQPLKQSVENIRTEIHKVVVGQDDMIDLLLAGLFIGGHVLIEGVPGIAKTLTVNLLAKTLGLGFRRLQFTPDLMPADVTGSSVFNARSGEFEFRPGPVFTNLVLIDEINRSPAKTQAALFEVMEEQQVSTDGITRPLPQPFMVMATQNPIEQEGTYRLPEAQQDRFMFRIKAAYPSLQEETEILRRFEQDFEQSGKQTIQPVLDAEGVKHCKKLVQQVYIQDKLLAYIATITDKTRHTPDLFLGASPRASLALVKTAKALAAIQGKHYVDPEDIHRALYPVLNHRLILSPEKEMEGADVQEVLASIIQHTDVPR